MVARFAARCRSFVVVGPCLSKCRPHRLQQPIILWLGWTRKKGLDSMFIRSPPFIADFSFFVFRLYSPSGTRFRLSPEPHASAFCSHSHSHTTIPFPRPLVLIIIINTILLLPHHTLVAPCALPIPALCFPHVNFLPIPRRTASIAVSKSPTPPSNTNSFTAKLAY